jgi:hypothetical protein
MIFFKQTQKKNQLQKYTTSFNFNNMHLNTIWVASKNQMNADLIYHNPWQKQKYNFQKKSKIGCKYFIPQKQIIMCNHFRFILKEVWEMNILTFTQKVFQIYLVSIITSKLQTCSRFSTAHYTPSKIKYQKKTLNFWMSVQH